MIEVPECGGNFVFVRDQENLSKTSIVINKGHKSSSPRGGCGLGWSPNITMDKSKSELAYRVAKEMRLGDV